MVMRKKKGRQRVGKTRHLMDVVLPVIRPDTPEKESQNIPYICSLPKNPSYSLTTLPNTKKNKKQNHQTNKCRPHLNINNPFVTDMNS
jgi:hypothetical protein